MPVATISKESYIGMRQNPVTFSKAFMKHNIYFKQKEIMEAVGQHDKVSVGSGHSIGKTWIASELAMWFLSTYPGSIVITTAHDWRQVKFQIWKEIRNKYKNSRFEKLFRQSDCSTTLLQMTDERDWFAIGFATKDKDKTAFQGYKSPYLMIILDEASGISQEVWTGAMSMETGLVNKVIALGNRLDPLCPFEHTFSNPRWKSFILSSRESPNVTGEKFIPGLATQEWINDMKEEFGKESLEYKIRVLGLCPKEQFEGIYNLDTLRNLERPPEGIEPAPPFYGGLDIADQGGDLTVFTLLDSKGQHIFSKRWNQKTTETEGRVIKLFDDYPFTKLAIDAIGVGTGVVEHLLEEPKLKGRIIPFKGSNNAREKGKYANRRAEVWHWFNELLEEGFITALQNTGHLFSDLIGVRRKMDSKGRLKLEKKDNFKKRYKRSPDDGDAMVLAGLAFRVGEIWKETTKEAQELLERDGERIDMNEYREDMGMFDV